MAYSTASNKNESDLKKLRVSNAEPVNAELIRALTPMFLAFVGGVIGLSALFLGAGESGFGLASTAIAGAAGLAQAKSQKDE